MGKQELHPRTAMINKKQKNLSKNARLDALRWLASAFPKAFDNSIQISPLKKGIVDDVLQHADEARKAGFSKSKLREAIVIFTRRIDYLTTLKARDMRIDLNGNPVAEVTIEEAENAAAKIKRRVVQSAKNARKNPLTKPLEAEQSKPAYHTSYPSEINAPTYYTDREPAYGTRSVQPQPARSTPVTIKHKSTRQYDPEAVARLKEKLGLSKKKQVVNDDG